MKLWEDVPYPELGLAMPRSGINCFRREAGWMQQELTGWQLFQWQPIERPNYENQHITQKP
jgi:hypothetical protein